MIVVLEIIQAGGNTLLKYDCPECNEKQLTGFPLPDCEDCGASLEGASVEHTDAQRRLLCPPRRIHRAGLTTAQIASLLAETASCCAYCDKPLGAVYHLEHIIPLAFGGANHVKNMTVSCPRCNQAAGSKVFGSFEAKWCYLQTKRQS
jgi:hypothetical protein